MFKDSLFKAACASLQSETELQRHRLWRNSELGPEVKEAELCGCVLLLINTSLLRCSEVKQRSEKQSAPLPPPPRCYCDGLKASPDSDVLIVLIAVNQMR